MTEAPAVRKAPPQAQSSGSIHTLMTSRQPYMSQPIASKRVCFYKSGDAQFSGLPVIINNRTFKTFEGLLDSLSKRVPLPFGVRTITTPRGHTTVHSLDQLHHGHAYICSDKRTVKPIDLERAQRKPPPWYNARPVSNRRVALQRQTPAQRNIRRARRNEHAALLHTPKRLVVFRNGDPEEKHTLMLQKRTTHSFEALLGLVSETMHFPVLKLHTPDGRRVDGLPALILCSGVLVAAGREPFKKGNYDVQKPAAPTWLPAKSVGRLHPVSRKKKSMSSTRSRPFSPSSERFIVNQIHSSYAGNAFDYPSNPTGSLEMETGQVLESVAETDTIACLDGEGDAEGDINMPTEDDIEKSFRVNQDGSMTVEMKVRLTIKEEETIHWTTTLSRSNVTNQLKTEPLSDLGATLSDTVPADVDPVAPDAIQNCPEQHSFFKESTEEMQAARAEDVTSVKDSPSCLPLTPGWRKVHQKQSIGSTVKVTESEIQENVLGSYAYREETSNGEMKQEHCMVQQCRSRPVPKPRINLPSEPTSTQLQSNTQHYKSAHIMQLQDNGEAVEETLRIYEQQSCQEDLYSKTQLCMPGRGTYSSVNSLPASVDTLFPASSENTVRSSSDDLESEPRDSRPQTNPHTLCQQSISQQCRSKRSKLCTSITDISKASPSTAISDSSKRRKPVRVIVKKNHIFQIPAPDKKKKDNPSNMFKEIKKIRADMFSQAGTMRQTEHYRSKAVHKLLKRRNNQSSHERIVPTLMHNLVKLTIESPNEVSAEREECTNTVNPIHGGLIFQKPNECLPSPKKDLLHTSTKKCILTRQMSMHEERNFQRETRELSESISLPALHSSSVVFNEYVKLWLQKSEPDLEQVPSPHIELQENHPQENHPQPFLGNAKKAGETKVATNTSNEDFSSYVFLRKPQFSPNTLMCSTKATEPTSPSSERNSIHRNSDIKETKSAQTRSTAQIPNPQTPPLKNIHTKNLSSENNHSSEKKIKPNIPQGTTSLGRTVYVKNNHATSGNNSSPSEVSLDMSNQEMPFPQDIIKMYSKSKFQKDSSSESSCNTGGQPPTPKSTSEKTLLLSQPSVDNIPKNNTLNKVSLFNNVEETPLSTKVTSDKKSGLSQSQTKLSKSKITLLSRSQASSDVTKTSEISIIPQVDTAEAHIKSPTETTVLQEEKFYTVKMAVRPDMRHVLEELCQSLHSLREVTHQKRRPHLEKSSSLPDFSSHLASTFGSPSQVLLAFLSVMTLKDGLSNLTTCRQAQDNLSCSEALFMLQSFKEMAAMEDAEKLRASLNALQNSTSVQLLQSWRGFQALSNMSRSHSVTRESSRSGSCSEEEAIQGLMEELGVPDRVREELAALCPQEEESIGDNQVEGLKTEGARGSLTEVKMNGFTESIVREDTISFTDSVFEEDVNLYVKSVIENAVKAHSEYCDTTNVLKTHLLASCGTDIKKMTEEHDLEFSEKQANHGHDTDECKDLYFHGEEQQQRQEEREVVPVIHEIDPKPQSNLKENEAMEENAESSACGARRGDIIEENLKHHMILENDQRNEEWMYTKDPGENKITEKSPKSFESPSSSEDKTNTSEEDKYSLEEEEDSCDEELMSFSEDQTSDKEENLQINPIKVSSTDKINSMTVPLSICQINQTQGQLHSNTDCAKEHTEPSETQVTLLPIQVESNRKEDMVQDSGHDIDQQQVIYEKQIVYSNEEQVVLEAPECYTIYQEHIVEENKYGPEEAVEFEEERKITSVAELISTLESVTKMVSKKTQIDTDISQMSSEQDRLKEFIKDPSKVEQQDKSVESGIQQVSTRQSPQLITIKQSHMEFTSEPLSSSLAFSYDSRSSSLAQDPEGSIQSNRVRSIQEMFLAKSNTRTQNGQRHLHSPNSDMSDYQTESNDDSGGNLSQTSPETSSGEDDTSRLAIAKGFVRRTIERLYGRSNPNSTGPEDNRPVSASKGQPREGPGRTNVTNLASFHEARTRVRTDLSYFNATSSIDVINEPTHCITLNAQVRPGNAVLIDKGRWLLRENQPISESSQELQETQRKVEKNSSIVEEAEQDVTKEDVPYSLFCPASPHSVFPSTNFEELSLSPEQKFTYFNLPNASDSELEQEGQNADTPSKREVKVTPITQSPKFWAEKNSLLPAFNPPVVKRADNKVHPFLEASTPPVVTQPGRGQGAKTEVTRCSTDSDVLEMLFLFCGQHCPIL